MKICFASSRHRKLIVLIAVALVCIPLFTTLNAGAAVTKKTKIKVGALLPLTGSLAYLGVASQKAIELAVEEVNALPSPIYLEVLYRDTETNPDVALAQLKDLYKMGIKFILGPMTSNEVQKIQNYANTNQILILSQSSTSPRLCQDDFIFRFCPNDKAERNATTSILPDDPCKVVVVHSTGSSGYGWDLAVSLYETAYHEAKGRSFFLKIGVDNTNMTEAASLVNANIEHRDAVLFIGTDTDAVAFFTEASKYPKLWNVKWFGAGGWTVKSQLLTGDLTVAEFCIATGFLAADFSPTRSFKYDRVYSELKSRGLDYTQLGLGYTFVAYDMVWALTYSYALVNVYDSVAVRAVLPMVTESLFGASGWTVLNGDGDRAFANYELWTVVPDGTAGYNWKSVGMYDPYTDEAEFFPP